MRQLTNHLVLTAILGIALQACVFVPPRNVLPESLADEAVVPGSPEARFWGDASPPDIEDRMERLKRQMEGNPSSPDDPRYYLTISGGGANGALAAGLCKGWIDAETGDGKEKVYDVV